MCYINSLLILTLISYTNGLIYINNNGNTVRVHDTVGTQTYIVEENQPLNIYFDDFTVTHGWCYNNYRHDSNLEKILPPAINNSCVYVSNVTRIMSTLWECVIYVDNPSMGMIPVNDTLKNKDVKRIKLNLHVKGAKRVRMIINDKRMEFTYNNISSHYDGFANYIFVENTSIYATCLNTEKRGKVQLIFSQTGNKSKAVYDSTSLMINLHLGLNNSYLDCEYISVEPYDKYIYRVYFITEYTPSNIYQLYNNDDISSNLIIIIGCISVLLLIITVVGIVYSRKILRRSNNAETPYNGLKEENEMTPIPESMNDSCYSENSTIQPNYDVPKTSDYSIPYYHRYEEVNYLQCKPKPSEPQQRSSNIYNVAYDHVRRCRSGK
ncbi:uncharacterized protein LOC118280320 [Spodoptera frugiperda]|uniref:Uncharacterized protein LOC118280320 n=1 Tax=Spodoptera frugiperda TaxID=7108 RepID=A0A9R0DJ62_SPOFR|nr:uncharacterized protein LOC118280320 [Spodoptera frugiperda]